MEAAKGPCPNARQRSSMTAIEALLMARREACELLGWVPR